MRREETERKGGNANAEPVALVACPGDSRGSSAACLRLPVLRADLYSSKTINLQPRLLILTTKVRGIVKNGVDSQKCVLTSTHCPVVSGVSGKVVGRVGDGENRPFRGQRICYCYTFMCVVRETEQEMLHRFLLVSACWAPWSIYPSHSLKVLVDWRNIGA